MPSPQSAFDAMAVGFIAGFLGALVIAIMTWHLVFGIQLDACEFNGAECHITIEETE